MRIVACAAEDPWDPCTFSGYSNRLFSALAAASNEILPIATSKIGLSDILRGALTIDPGRWPRIRPRVNPNWYWSRGSFEVMAKRFNRKLNNTAGIDAIIQIGTHILPSDRATPFYCVTDATIRQVTEAGKFSVSNCSPSVIEEAMACQREVFRRCWQIFVLSEWTASGIVSDYGISRDRVSVIGAGANVPVTSIQRAGSSSPSILFVGYDWERKGGPLLLEAFRVVKKKVPSAELMVVGCSPPVEERGIKIIGKLNPRSQTDRIKLVKLYSQASVFSILPTFDPFPNVLLEAAMFGLPIVSVDEGSRREAVIDGVTGFLATHRDPEAIAALLIRLLTDAPLAHELGDAARERAIRQFTWPVVAGAMLNDIKRRNSELRNS
ncbi:glycosyltransferase family 4 protein [Sinorhizobium meliloti]|uniref:glycosyltransferase family 4 protein n=1 Tax=Rhizobium meliloti TaxID=382 RepID=UPI0003771108|nr:glycosyltransferase family 4 protein [Sinorhizobium meliloti]